MAVALYPERTLAETVSLRHPNPATAKVPGCDISNPQLEDEIENTPITQVAGVVCHATLIPALLAIMSLITSVMTRMVNSVIQARRHSERDGT